MANDKQWVKTTCFAELFKNNNTEAEQEYVVKVMISKDIHGLDDDI